jgi:hypothetical protein
MIVFGELLLESRKDIIDRVAICTLVGDKRMILLFRLRNYVFPGVIGIALFLTGCATSDSTLREHGHNESYIQGFHDGRHSGMAEAGNYLEHIVKNSQRYANDAEYRAGWLAGEAEGRQMQEEASAASGAYTGSKIKKEYKKSHDYNAIGRDAVKGVDPKSLEPLYKK